MKKIEIVVIDYPSASQSAVHGFVETIEVANSLCHQLDVRVTFRACICSLDNLDVETHVDVVVLPPCVNDNFYTENSEVLNQYLSVMHRNGATLASACVGAFVLARGGFLDNKFCTTHWRLADLFNESFPKAKLNANAIIVNEGNVITAGGAYGMARPCVRSHILFLLSECLYKPFKGNGH